MKMLFYSIMYKKVRVYLEGIHYYTLWVVPPNFKSKKK